MKNISLLYSFLGVVLFFTNSCKKEEGNKLPELITTQALKITATTATSGGIITFDGGANISEKGICYSAYQLPTITSKKVVATETNVNYSCNLTELKANTTYYVRAFAINRVGTAYGDQVTFKTVSKVVDVEGNVYGIVTIGNQTWMKDNLKTTKYNDGTDIPNVTANTTWNIQTGAYCWYNNDSATYKNTYGVLYNWYTVVDSHNLCPTGWHVPSYDEWAILIGYLGNSGIAGGKLKETGVEHWQSPNSGATNGSHFTALPGGVRLTNGTFQSIGTNGYWWSSWENPNSPDVAYGLNLTYNIGYADFSGSYKKCGFSVRCIMD